MDKILTSPVNNQHPNLLQTERHRYVTLDQKPTVDNSVLEFSFSSELPVETWFGEKEILQHEPESVDLYRLKNKAPLLFNHDRNAVIGVVKDAWLEDRRLRARVRFDTEAQGSEIYRQVQNGILANVSFAYRVHAYTEETRSDGIYIIGTKWEPLEISIVSVPADPTVGIGRTLSYNSPIPQDKPSINMSVKEESTVTEVDFTTERQRASAVMAFCSEHRLDSKFVERSISEGWSIEKTRSEAQEILSLRYDAQIKEAEAARDKYKEALEKSQITPGQPISIGMTPAETRQYSVTRLIRHVSGLKIDSDDDAGFELEIDQEMRSQYKKQGLSYKERSAIIPFEVTRASASVANQAYAGLLVETDRLDLIDLYRAQSIILSMGATYLPGLVGDVEWIRRTADSQKGSWVAEGLDVTEIEFAVGTLLKMSPKTYGAFMRYTRKLLLQSSYSIENMVREELMRNMALEFDRVALTGTGTVVAPNTGEQPRGLLNTAGTLSHVLGANGGPMSADIPVRMETKLMEAYVPDGFAWLTSARGLEAIRLMNDTQGHRLHWYDPATTLPSPATGRAAAYNGTWDGIPLKVGDTVPSNLTKGTGTNLTVLVLGQWSAYKVGLWGGLEIMLDPYRAARSGGIELIAMQSMDTAITTPQSFVVCTDLARS